MLEGLFLVVAGVIAGIGLLIATVTAIGEACGLVGRYAVLTVRVLHLRTPEYEVIAPYRPQDEPVPAYRNYFLGQALRDVRQLTVLGPRMVRGTVAEHARTAYRENVTDSAGGVLDLVRGLSIALGHLVGGVLAAPLLAAVLLLHAVLVLLPAGAALAAAGLLRGLDLVALRLRGLGRGMLCPSCFERVRRPAYACPRADCLRRHPDIGPGRYGVLRHRCQCGQVLPTLRWLMRPAGRLQPYCPHAGCGEPMNKDAGHMRELALPLIGGRAAGKTQLMAAMTTALEYAAAHGGPAFRPADEESRERYEVAREVLTIGGHPRSTRPERSRAHSFVRGGRLSRRLIHVFDTAGERFTSREGTDPLRYASAARTFVFVLDPLAVDDRWPGVDRALASPVHPEHVFGPAVQAVRAMGTPRARRRLAVAISKADLLEAYGLLPERREGSAAAREWLCAELGLTNLVHAMEHHFREVRFFFTAAVLEGAGDSGAGGGGPGAAESGAAGPGAAGPGEEDGDAGDAGPPRVDPSIGPLADWCLGRRPARATRGDGRAGFRAGLGTGPGAAGRERVRS
ncbi:TRAFAC clade GTPase domain-containing protein [Streptomyces sp. NBC_00239]|uniref:TRAFAC clade GTPase domain-containing protein n=1 Tax=Streptomyces sp. NBC_00239 TaxID=2903640 RepID=UPI002E2C1391|nr:hypothetical protein [Streptomyces sp. NBC_00239]